VLYCVCPKAGLENCVGRLTMSTLKTGPADHRSFLTPREVSDLLRVSVYTVRRWIKEGDLPAYKVGRGWRISESDIGDWLLRNQSSAVTKN
jgi:excisionase family DNA binding protein